MSGSSGFWDAPDTGDGVRTADVDRRRADVRRALVELVRTRRPVAEDQERLDGYLRDVCPNEPAEVAVVVVAARAGVPGELAHATEGHAVEAMAARLADRMHGEAGVDRALARWAVDTWAVALGRMPESPGGPSAEDRKALEGIVARHAEAPPTPVLPPPRPAPVPETSTRLPGEADPLPQRTRSRPPAAPPSAPPPAPAGPSRRSRVLVPAAGVGALAVLALVVALTRGGGSPRAAPPTTNSSQPADPTTVTTSPPRAFPTAVGPLPAATYTTAAFRPGLTLTVGDAWEVVTTDRPELVEIGSDAGLISFVHLTRVLAATGTYPTRQDVARATQPVPADLPAWLAANSHLTTTRPVSATISGASGAYLGATVTGAYGTELCRRPGVPLWPFEDTSLSYGCLGPDDRHRVYTLDVKGEKVMIIVKASADQFDKFLPEAEKVLASLSFAA